MRPHGPESDDPLEPGDSLPYEHDHDGEEPRGVICPSCGEQGFDGRGVVVVQGTRMYLRGCWNCGVEFAVEDPHPDAEDGAPVATDDGTPAEQLANSLGEACGRKLAIMDAKEYVEAADLTTLERFELALALLDDHNYDIMRALDTTPSQSDGDESADE